MVKFDPRLNSNLKKSNLHNFFNFGYFLIKISEKNELSLKRPNPAGYRSTPSRKKVRWF